MERKEILKGLKNAPMDFIYKNFNNLTDEQKRKILLSALYILSNNDLISNEHTVKNTLIDELEYYV